METFRLLCWNRLGMAVEYPRQTIFNARSEWWGYSVPILLINDGFIMQIQRNRSRSSYRTRRRQAGCLPLTLLLMVLLGVFMGSRNWLDQRLNNRESPQSDVDLQAANHAFDEGDLGAAVNLTRQLWATNPQQTESLVLLVRALIYRSYTDHNRTVDREVALQLTTDALKRFPTHPDVMAIHALALQANGIPVQAWNLAEAILKRQPDHTLARVALSLAYGSIGGHENALQESQLATTPGQWQIDALRAQAISLADLGRYEEAINTQEIAIGLNNKLLTLHFEQAQYALQKGDTDTATVAYFRILAFDPQNVKVRLRLCELSQQLGNQDAAVEYCREVTLRAPGWVEGWHVQGRIHFLRGDFAAAQQSLYRCATLAVTQDIPIEQRPFECWYLQGQAAEILGDCESLLTAYNEFQSMAVVADLPQTWTFPPEGPPICATATPGS
jgi:tetratricopeptide (TPR) repeat protein